MSDSNLEFSPPPLPLRPGLAVAMDNPHLAIPHPSTCTKGFASTSPLPCAPRLYSYRLACAANVAMPSRSVAAFLGSHTASLLRHSMASTNAAAESGLS
jgi:hypothetical protein